MGKLMVGVRRILPLYAALLVFALVLTVFMPALASAASVTLQPDHGPVGTAVLATGTDWPPSTGVLIYFESQLIGGPVTTDARGAFSASFTVPARPPGLYPVSFTDGRANFAPSFTITAGGQPPPQPSPPPGQSSQNQLPPEIVRAETFREGVLVFFRVFFTDPNNDAIGFRFRWPYGVETHPFSDPSFGRVSPGSIGYPFNLGCGTVSEYTTTVEVWIYDNAGLFSRSVTVHLACTEFKFPWDANINNGDGLPYTGGPHFWISPTRSGVDFSSGSRTTHVLAMADGVVTFLGEKDCVGGKCKTVVVNHNSGFETWYVHLDDFAPDIRSACQPRPSGECASNVQVLQGKWLGNEGDTGANGVVHIHIELRENGLPVSWHNRSIDGWTFHEDCDGYNQAYNTTQPGATLAVCHWDGDNNYDGYISRENPTQHAVPIDSPTPSTPQHRLRSTNHER